MELHEALGQISEIRQHMARQQVFRGYGSVAVGSVGLLAILAAAVQPRLVPAPAEDLRAYLVLWIAVAATAFLLMLAHSWRRVHATGSALVRQSALLSADQFLPCVAVGALLTVAVFVAAPESGWMLPGLWALVFSLGVFATHRQLPRPTFWVGVYFVVSGFACLMWGRGEHAYSPWQMALTFGVGLLLGATILHFTLERDHEASR